MTVNLGLRPTARELGVSHVALLKAESEGRVPKRVNGLFDLEACRKALGANSHPTKARAGRSQQVKPETVPSAPAVQTVPPAPDPDEEEFVPSGQTIAEATRQLEWEKVRALKLKTDTAAGTLVEIVAVNAFVAGMIVKCRDELVRIGAEIADAIARESEPAKCRALVEDRIFQALENLKEYRPA